MTGKPAGAIVWDDTALPGKEGMGVTTKVVAAWSQGSKEQDRECIMNLTGEPEKSKQRITSTMNVKVHIVQNWK